MTKEELKHNFINGVMDLRNKGLVEQDSLLDLFEDVIEPCIADLEAQIEKMKNCKNCANYMISGKCPCLFRTGWCKNWELAK